MEAEAVLQLAVLLQLLLLVLQLALPLLAMAILPLLPLLPLPQRQALLHRVLPIAKMMKDGHFTATTETGLVAATEDTAVGSDTIAEKAVTLANEHEHTLNTTFYFPSLFIDFSIT